MFKKILVANRGEIAVRVLRCLKEMGIASVAVHSDIDADALHVQLADEAVSLGGSHASESYLRAEKILAAARASGAEAIHPGYGFLSENAAFARACREAGLVFIGPGPEAMESMGSKIAARKCMIAAGVPVVPGIADPVATVAEAVAIARDIGFPVAVKASGGGGGRGFRVAHSEADIEAAFTGASGEAERFFNDATVYIEKYLEDPRHIEVQVLADQYGNTIHLGERDCSIQRRHQKLIEESPAPSVDPAMRERLGEIAVQAAKAIGYSNAGTVEGLLDGDQFYFLEMNTRLQVEHPVTEMVTGIDLVREQILIAAGETLRYTQQDIQLRGAAIECRINAESAAKGFLPRVGTITSYREPGGDGVRVDSGVTENTKITPFYDSMLAKLIVWDEDREAATAKMLKALSEFEIEGVTTLLDFHRALLAHEEWRRGGTARTLVSDKDWLKQLSVQQEILA